MCTHKYRIVKIYHIIGKEGGEGETILRLKISRNDEIHFFRAEPRLEKHSALYL